MKVKFNADTFVRAIEAYAERKQRQIQTGLQLACIEVQGRAMDKCPKDTDALRQSITYKVEMHDSKGTGTVGSELDYAPFVHEGTGIHSRTGKGRKDVPWTYRDEKGEFHVTSGMEPNPFLEEARNESKERVLQILFDAMKG